MPKSKEEILEIYEIGCAMMIFTFDTIELTSKKTLLRNFAAKSISQLLSIRLLNRCNQTFDCFIIYRSMLDRLAHLYYLERTDTFEQFEKWSYMKQCEANNNSLSDEMLKDSLNKELFLSTPEEKKKYNAIKESGFKWSRPDIKSEFKDKGYYFLYQFGYDHASTHVHPMANDGMIEYFAIAPDKRPDHISTHIEYQSQIILKNAALVSSLTVQACLNSSNYNWRSLVYDFLETFNECYDNYTDEFENNFLKIKSLVENNLPLGQKNPK